MSHDRAAPATAWGTLRANPWRLLWSSWPWRSLAYLSLGLPLLACAALSGVALAAVERRRLHLVDSLPAPSPHRVPEAPGAWTWLTCRLREVATWQELACAPLFCALGLVDFALSVMLVALVAGLLSAPLQSLVLSQFHQNAAWQRILRDGGSLLAVSVLGLWAAAGSAYLVTAWAALEAGLLRRLLVRPADGGLSARIVELTESRARIVDAYEVERRRMERDLHDGVQQRLTALIMTIGLAGLELTDGPAAARNLIARAHDEARKTLQELRDLVRGIVPSVLADRGLEAAVTARRAGGTLTVEIRDDGVGGASAGGGGGLVGLADRVAALGGLIRLSSPPGGPSVLHV